MEAGVRFAQTYILGRLRHQTFFSLADANSAIALVLERMNGHVMRRLGLSRKDYISVRDWRRKPPLRLRVAKKLDFCWCWIKCNRCPHTRAVAIAPFNAGGVVFKHACKLGLEGIISKRRDIPYQHGRSRAWLKIKNPASPAMTRVWEDRL